MATANCPTCPNAPYNIFANQPNAPAATYTKSSTNPSTQAQSSMPANKVTITPYSPNNYLNSMNPGFNCTNGQCTGPQNIQGSCQLNSTNQTITCQMNGTSNTGVNMSGGSMNQINSDYAKWKGSAQFNDYLSLCKYIAWQQASQGKTEEWPVYGEWLIAVWKPSNKQMHLNEFANWRTRNDWNDYRNWREWSKWKTARNTFYTCNNNKNMWNKYVKFVKNSRVKEFANYLRWQQWCRHAENNGMTKNNFESYYQWVDKYTFDRPLINREYDTWHKYPNGDDMLKWMKWLGWKGLKREYDDSTEETRERHRNRRDKRGDNWWKR
jgi:hypothetical protein